MKAAAKPHVQSTTALVVEESKVEEKA